MEKITKFSELLSINPKGEYLLGCDIDCNGAKIEALIKDDFKGYLDGNGHKIHNLIVSEEVWRDCQPIALFGEIKKAQIRNLFFENIFFDIDESDFQPEIAVLCVKSTDSLIENVVCSIKTKNNKEIPMIYESSNTIIKDSKNICNGQKAKISLYDL